RLTCPAVYVGVPTLCRDARSMGLRCSLMRRSTFTSRENTMPTISQTPRRLRQALAIPAGLALAACAAAPPPPPASLDAARQAIPTAERPDAAQHAPAELNQARTNIAAAQAEVSAEKMVAAERLADQSRADAELASAKAGAAKARSMNE